MREEGEHQTRVRLPGTWRLSGGMGGARGVSWWGKELGSRAREFRFAGARLGPVGLVGCGVGGRRGGGRNVRACGDGGVVVALGGAAEG